MLPEEANGIGAGKPEHAAAAEEALEAVVESASEEQRRQMLRSTLDAWRNTPDNTPDSVEAEAPEVEMPEELPVQLPIPPTAESVPEPARKSGDTEPRCYLVFSSASHGSFFLQWATQAVEGALACFQPHKPVPLFKLRTNSGRSELCREVGGPNKKNFYKGWVSFIKMAVAYEGRFVHLANLQQLGVAIYLSDTLMGVSRLELGDVTDFSDIRAVAVVGLLSQGLSNVRTMETRIFHQVGERLGASLALDGGGDGVVDSPVPISPSGLVDEDPTLASLTTLVERGALDAEMARDHAQKARWEAEAEQQRYESEEARLHVEAAQQLAIEEPLPAPSSAGSDAPVRRSYSVGTARGRACDSNQGGVAALFNGTGEAEEDHEDEAAVAALGERTAALALGNQRQAYPPVPSAPAYPPAPPPRPRDAGISAVIADSSVAKCFLTFTSADTGMFKLNWSMNAVPGALAVFVPKKPPAMFKLRNSGGVSELTRDCGGPNPKRFYQGWTSFVKTARSFEGRFAQIGNVELLPVTIYLNDARYNVVKMAMGDVTDFVGIKAAAVVGTLRTDLHVGKMQTQLFQQTGERIGSALGF